MKCPLSVSPDVRGSIWGIEGRSSRSCEHHTRHFFIAIMRTCKAFFKYENGSFSRSEGEAIGLVAFLVATVFGGKDHD